MRLPRIVFPYVDSVRHQSWYTYLDMLGTYLPQMSSSSCVCWGNCWDNFLTGYMQPLLQTLSNPRMGEDWNLQKGVITRVYIVI